MPTHEEEFQPPSFPWPSGGLLTVGTAHVPTAVTQLPEMLPPPQLFEEKPVFVLTSFLRLCVTPRLVSRCGTTQFSGSHFLEKTLRQVAWTSGGSSLDGRRRKMPCFMSSEALAVLGSNSSGGAGVANAPSRFVGINWCGSRCCKAPCRST